MASVADDFLTARVINVPVKLIFSFQDSKGLRLLFLPFHPIADEKVRFTNLE